MYSIPIHSRNSKRMHVALKFTDKMDKLFTFCISKHKQTLKFHKISLNTKQCGVNLQISKQIIVIPDNILNIHSGKLNDIL